MNFLSGITINELLNKMKLEIKSSHNFMFNNSSDAPHSLAQNAYDFDIRTEFLFDNSVNSNPLIIKLLELICLITPLL